MLLRNEKMFFKKNLKKLHGSYEKCVGWIHKNSHLLYDEKQNNQQDSTRRGKQVSWKSNPPPPPPRHRNSKKFMRDGKREKVCMPNKQFEREGESRSGNGKILLRSTCNLHTPHSTSCGQCNTNPNFRGGCVTFHEGGGGGGSGVGVYTLFPQFHFYSSESYHKHTRLHSLSFYTQKSFWWKR